jgi:hypothetical protein
VKELSVKEWCAKELCEGLVCDKVVCESAACEVRWTRNRKDNGDVARACVCKYEKVHCRMSDKPRL